MKYRGGFGLVPRDRFPRDQFLAPQELVLGGDKTCFVPLRPLLIPLAKKIFLTSSPPPLRRGRGGGYA